MNCEACGGADTRREPTREYKNGGHYHDHCAIEIGMEERDLV